MKKYFILLSLIFTHQLCKSQQVGIGTIFPDSSAALDINSTNKGLLIPRVALLNDTDTSTIINPTAGLLIINSGSSPSLTQNAIYQFDGTKWNLILTKENTILSGDITGTLANNNISGINGKAFSFTSLTSGNLLQYNGTNWVNVTPASILGAISVSNNSNTNTLTTTVNGVTGTGVNIVNSNNLTWTQAAGVTSSINGVSQNITPVSGTIAQVLGYNAAGIPVYNTPASILSSSTSVSNNSSTNTLTMTVNGVTGTGVNIVNSNTLINPTINTIASSVNGVTSSNATIIGSNNLTWTQATGVTSSINGISQNITPASGTIAQVLGYNATGTPVYNTPTSLGTVTLSSGTTGTDINITGSPISLGGSATINNPDASATARGVVTTGTQTIAGNKTLTGSNTFSNLTTTITSGTAGNSGLVLTNLPSTSTLSSNPNNVALSVDTTGRITLSAMPSASVFDAFATADQNYAALNAISYVNLTQRTSSPACTLSGNTITFNQAGTYLITYSVGTKTTGTVATALSTFKAFLELSNTAIATSSMYSVLEATLLGSIIQSSSRTIAISVTAGQTLKVGFNTVQSISLGAITTEATATGITIQKIN